MFNKRKMTFQLVDHSIDLFSSRRLSDTYVMQRIYRVASEYDIEIKQITSKSGWDVTFSIKATAKSENLNAGFKKSKSPMNGAFDFALTMFPLTTSQGPSPSAISQDLDVFSRSAARAIIFSLYLGKFS